MQIQIRDNKHITFHPITPRQIGALGSGPKRIRTFFYDQNKYLKTTYLLYFLLLLHFI